MRLLVEGGLPLAGGIIGAVFEEVRWPRPVRPGEPAAGGKRVLEVRPVALHRPEAGDRKVRTNDG